MMVWWCALAAGVILCMLTHVEGRYVYFSTSFIRPKSFHSSTYSFASFIQQSCIYLYSSFRSSMLQLMNTLTFCHLIYRYISPSIYHYPLILQLSHSPTYTFCPSKPFIHHYPSFYPPGWIERWIMMDKGYSTTCTFYPSNPSSRQSIHPSIDSPSQSPTHFIRLIHQFVSPTSIYPSFHTLQRPHAIQLTHSVCPSSTHHSSTHTPRIPSI